MEPGTKQPREHQEQRLEKPTKHSFSEHLKVSGILLALGMLAKTGDLPTIALALFSFCAITFIKGVTEKFS